MDRQVMYRALDAARAVHLFWGWRLFTPSSITILTAPGSAAPPYSLLDREVPAFLVERIARERCGMHRWPIGWERLLDCMERLAEQVPWWEVPCGR